MVSANQPHPKNVSGPFYVLNGCCTACDVPISEAPDLLTYDETNHCYVKRQPCTKDEVDRTLRAAWAAELECIRYRGNDSEVLRRFAEFGAPHLCDVPPPPEIRPVERDLVTFDTESPDYVGLSAVDLAEAYRVYLLRLNSQREGLTARFRYRLMPVVGNPATASFTYSWFEDDRHTVEFRVIGAPEVRWMICHFSAGRVGGRGVSNRLDDWLKGAGSFCRIRWYSAEEWAVREAGRESPQ
jgi:hypothetical protein